MTDEMSPRGDIRPVPDPTKLTQQATTRLETMMRSLISAEIGHQGDLFDEKLIGVSNRFEQLEARTAEQKQDTKAALDAALAAQKEAVASQTSSSEKSITKSETATTERIKGVETLLSTSAKATDDKIIDLKDRVTVMEAIKLGTVQAVSKDREQTIDARSARDSITAQVAIGAVAISGILGFLAAHFK